jgi:hypothetical protein
MEGSGALSTTLNLGSYWASANDVFTSTPFIIAVVFAIGWWTYDIGSPVHRAGLQLRVSLTRLRRALEKAGNASELPTRYEALHEDIKTDRLLGDAWNALDATLAKPSAPNRPFRQTVPASEFFHLGLLQTAGADMRSTQAHSNMLVGVGLLLTFIGLVLALHSAGESLGSTDPAAVRSGLQQLLAASATKFLFSVVGLGISLSFSLWLRRTLRLVEGDVDQLLQILNTRLPPLAEQDVALEGNELLNRILAAQETFSADLAASLTSGLDQSFNARLSEQIVPLREAVERMAASMADMNRGALNEMIERFVAQLEGAAGTQIRELTGGLERVGVQLSGLVTGLSDVQRNLADAGQTAASDIARAMTDAATRMAESAEATRATMDAVGREMSGAVSEATQTARASIIDGAAVFGTTMADGVGRITDGVERALEDLTAAATNAAREFGSVVSAASSDLRGAAEATRGAIAQAAEAFGDSTMRAARELAGTLAGFQSGMTALDGRLREAEAALVAAREALVS